MQNIKKIYYFIKELYFFYKNRNKLSYSYEISSFFAKAYIENVKINIPIRSLKILKRLNNFSKNKNDIVFSWLSNLKECKTFYDIGSANGLEGFFVNSKYNSKVVFFESYIPSLEDLLKGVYLMEKINNKNYEIIQAACGEKSDFLKIYSHSPPKSGYTFNTHELDIRDNHLWKNNPINSSNWTFAITVDDVQNKLKIDPPTHIKIDVDGFELKVLKGSTKTLEQGLVKEWMIEIHKKNEKEVYEIMNKNGYIEKIKHKHYSDENSCWDSLFIKNKHR